MNYSEKRAPFAEMRSTVRSRIGLKAALYEESRLAGITSIRQN